MDSSGHSRLQSYTKYDVNSSAPWRFKVNFRWVILKLILVVNGWGISCETVPIWMSLDHTYGKSALVQVMAWCHQATSHYLSQCWPRSLSPYGITRPQCNTLLHVVAKVRAQPYFTDFECWKETPYPALKDMLWVSKELYYWENWHLKAVRIIPMGDGSTKCLNQLIVIVKKRR